MRQRETRDLYGYNGKLTHHALFSDNRDLSSSIGAGWQLNRIYGSELSHTRNYDDVLQYLQFGDVREMALNGYLGNENYRTDVNGF